MLSLEFMPSLILGPWSYVETLQGPLHMRLDVIVGGHVPVPCSHINEIHLL
jgi:hypothetical protein